MTTPSPKFAAWAARPDARVAIAGASGWIGRCLTHMAVDAGLPPERLRLFGSRAGRIEAAGRALTVEPLDGAARLGAGDWLVFHAAVAGPDRIGGDWRDAAPANDALLAAVLALADRAGAQRLIFTSSGAAGADAPTAYGAMKRAQEARVAACGLPALIPRIFNVGGPYITHPQRYALGDFIDQLIQARPIHVSASRPVFRSYVHGLELARVLFDAALDEGAPTAPFDTAGEIVVEMEQLAQAVAAALGRPDAVIVRTPITNPDVDRYVGDGETYRRLLAASGAAPTALADIIRDTAAYLSRRS